MTERDLVGNRLALVGAIVYLLEWVAILALLGDTPSDAFGAEPSEIVAAYEGEARATGFAAGWFSLVLLGRVLFVAAVRRAFIDAGRRSILLDLALGAMIVSVAVEIVSLGLPAAAAWIAESGDDPSAIVALDAAASVTFAMVFAPIGVAVGSIATVMVTTRTFRRWIGWLGIVAAVLIVVGALSGAATIGDADAREAGQQPGAIGALLFWIWMLATAIVLWRRTPRRDVSGATT